MQLQSLLSAIPFINTQTAPITPLEISGITEDSRKVKPGMIFVALTGSQTDGHQYLSKAIESGAVVVVVEESRLASISVPESVTVLSGENTWKALGALAHEFYGRPAQKMTMIGVTGTNGKTTVTHLIEQILKDQGQNVGLIGTLGLRQPKGSGSEDASQYQSTGHTTPMAVELHQLLAELAEQQTQSVVLEVSSHALDQDRVYGCDFQVAVHTNLTQDHLDYHKTMSQYCEAKCKLFSQLNPAKNPVAVINLDDEWSAEFVAAVPPGVRQLTYSLANPQAAVQAQEVHYTINGAAFTVVTPEGSQPVQLKIAGKFGVYNALAAIAAGLGVGIPLAQVVCSLEKVNGIRGRFEVVAQNPYVIVDYAHTPDGLENILSAARLVTPEGGRLITVFGCGGDRDTTKRPKMGRIAEVLSDVVMITSDNPRTEDPQQILTDILTGIQTFDASRMMVNPDRLTAIHQAIDLAKPEDVIVVAGKGHEDYQILSTGTIHFDDREVVQNYVAERSKALASA